MFRQTSTIRSHLSSYLSYSSSSRCKRRNISLHTTSIFLHLREPSAFTTDFFSLSNTSNTHQLTYKEIMSNFTCFLLGIAAAFCCMLTTCDAFTVSSPSVKNVPFRSFMDTQNPRSSPSLLMATPKATLTEETTWRLRFSLNGVPTKNGRKVGELFNVDVQFIEEEGYGECLLNKCTGSKTTA
jgi:hypothetical protein